MLSRKNRHLITTKLGKEVDALVKDLYSDVFEGVSTAQEPEITSRLCQRLEDRLDGQEAGSYIFRVIAQSVPDRGPRSLEKITGADLFMSVSLDGPDGFDKGIFIQAKYDRNIKRAELQQASNRMRQFVGKRGAYVWIYEPDGVKVLSAHQVEQMRDNSLAGIRGRSMTGFAGRILDCYAGNRGWGVPLDGNRRQALKEKLQGIRADNGLDIALKRRS